MFGQNAITRQSHINPDPGDLNVHSIFATLQGEGPDAGTPAVFIRMAKCNLRCWFCDTEFEKGKSMYYQVVADRVVDNRRGREDLVVITGGEPFLYDLSLLINELVVRGYRVQLETSGSLKPVSMEMMGAIANPYVSVVCSPKVGTMPKTLRPFITAYKYVVSDDMELSPHDGLPLTGTQDRSGRRVTLARPPGGVPVYVQPIDEQDEEKNKKNTDVAVRICTIFGYRLSLQQHKILELP